MQRGTLFIISAASGTGKTSLIDAIIQNVSGIQMSVSYTTRAKRPKEQHGVNYFFVSEDKFQEMAAKGEFLEYAKVFGSYYGTAKAQVEKVLQQGQDLILEIDWQGAASIKNIFDKDEYVSTFVLPPSKQALQDRLTARDQDPAVVIADRMSKMAKEIEHYIDYDYLIVNDSFAKTVEYLTSIITAKRLQTRVQAGKYQQLLKELLG